MLSSYLMAWIPPANVTQERIDAGKPDHGVRGSSRCHRAFGHFGLVCGESG